MPAFDRRSCLRVIPILAGIFAVLPGAQAQNLDGGKSGAQLFAGSCVDCHHGPRGLAKGRYSWTLSLFLQKHYTSSAASAQLLAAYLQSADAAQPNPPKSKSRAAKSRVAPASDAPAPVTAPATVADAPSRPPAAIPAQ
ncbi:MAG TPA: cytochrome C [Xanthobacteraceae bacterium]|jgi:mono/diheme cytochrome c family protein